MMQEKYSMSLEHLTVSVGKEMLFKKEEEKKRTREPTRGEGEGSVSKGQDAPEKAPNSQSRNNLSKTK